MGCSADLDINTTPIAAVTATQTEQATALPTPTLQPTLTPTQPEPTATPKPTLTATQVPTDAPTTAPTPTPTLTPTPTTQGAIEMTVRVLSEITDKPIEEAIVQLVSDSGGYNETRASNERGEVLFVSMPPEETYSLLIEGNGFLPFDQTFAGDLLTETMTAHLTDMVMVTITRINVHIRTGPGTEFGSLGLAVPDEQYRVVGISADSEWLLIDTDVPVNSWIKLLPNTMTFNGDIDAMPIVGQ